VTTTPTHTPCYFGAVGQRCFGWLHAPMGPARATGVILVGPIGYESLSTHRALRHLADRLARAGFPVLRYDHPGTGDSEGALRGPLPLRAWIDGVGAAIAHLREHAGVTDISLFGLRLGATLATVAAAERGDVASLVLLAPCATGRAYVREVRAYRLLKQQEDRFDARPAESAREGDEEAAGFQLPADLVTALRGLSALELGRRPAPSALVIGRDDLPSEDALVASLTAAGVAVSHRAIPGYAALMRDAHVAVVPAALFDEIAAWLSTTHPQVVPASPAPLAAREPPTIDLGAVRETALSFDGGRLFGVLTEATAPAQRPRATVILLNAGAVHHIGNNRMYVTFARAWAARGLTVLRLDVGGIGESGPAPGNQENDVYATTVVADIQTAMRELGARGPSRFLLVGLCSGAYAAFRAALVGGPIVGCVMMNPQTFHWKEGDTLDVTPATTANAAAHYKRAFFRRESWAKMLGGKVDLKKLAGVVARRAQSIAEAKLDTLRRAAGLLPPPGQGDLAVDLRFILDAGIEVFMVFSIGDPGLDLLTLKVGAELDRLKMRLGFRMDFIDGTDHTFTPVWSQEALERLLTEYLVARGVEPATDSVARVE